MCDYSLHSIKSRPAEIGDKLTTRDFGTGTRGFAASENPSVAVCVLAGTELAFAHEVERLPTRLWPWHDSAIEHRTAIFRQINKEKVVAHHDALGLRGLNFHTMAVCSQAATFPFDQVREVFQERCHANLHLAWSVHVRRRQRHAG